jgi:hypothetical protein
MHASPRSPHEEDDDFELDEPAPEDADLEEVEVAAGFDMKFEDELDWADEDMSALELEFYLAQGKDRTTQRAPVDSVWNDISSQINDFFKDS